MVVTSSTFFSILVNGSPSTTISPSRGIRQGDPLSPFFLMLIVESLSCSIKATPIEGKITKNCIHGDNLISSHLLFVDDTLLMWVSNVQKSKALKMALQESMEALGTSNNLSKSQIFFFNNLLESRSHISRV